MMRRDSLPSVKGKYFFDIDLKTKTFLGTGGICSVFFEPLDTSDLQFFIKNRPAGLMIHCFGNFSNVLIRDKKLDACIICLKNTSSSAIEFFSDSVKVGAGVLLSSFINACIENNLSCCEELVCIPGTIGGAVYMNAGIPSFEISKVVKAINFIDRNGDLFMVTKKDLRMEYRKSNIDPSYIIESVILETRTSVKKNLIETTQSIKQKRIKSQPIFEKTCGSTFKNPSNLKAWELINGSGCAGMSWGGAFVSPKHCNFLINDGSATSFDFLNLINAIREKVQEETGVMLELEIIII